MLSNSQPGKEFELNIARIGLDLAKNDFQVHGVDRQEKAVRPATRLRPYRAAGGRDRPSIHLPGVDYVRFCLVAGDKQACAQVFAGFFDDNDLFRQEFLRHISGRMP